ncbi:MAG: magnesium chelatase [Henriciella sp.]|jgi:MoxR-like ATPase|uniref:AAA family ATPase n=1 Tax=uncultured Henriciella sp. TaxID=1608424 RepID=UPI000C645C0B|nr:MoxR family ATPase [Henriciella sp.]MAN74330.1 magnesium chelatase [Henriciella sp.]MBF34513.1 magnesium chelatase [Hyphomonadaceae bacterium]MBK76761.1 magnesium chelatase [Henriciella sp.]|tara:strand:- start:1617 stop:2573 length:957 start_codon:yes stop_codon:yes gene_type:complete
MSNETVQALAARIRSEVSKAVIGQSDTVDLMLTALFSAGHILLEGPPGTAKTLLTQCFAAAIDLDFGRIQFTPDLMPGDVLGTNLFNFQTNEFSLTKGPIFTDILLADEINRTPPKTQAALLEAMQERKVTIDGKPHSLNDRFMVIATQNPIEQQGTYPLPEAQLDRFLFKHVLDYPSREEELAIVTGHGNRTGMRTAATFGVSAVVTPAELNEAVASVANVKVKEDIAGYIVDVVRATRQTPALETGASPRAAAAIAAAARARAALDGRDFVIPDDVKTLARPALRHRVILSPAAEIEGRSTDETLATIIDQTPAPR